MNTIIEKTDKDNIDKEVILKAADILRNGGLVAFPTETVYGLGGNALDAKASEKIYAAKGRPSDNLLIVHISRVEDLYELSPDVSPSALKLAKAFWPGPLTMILPKLPCVPDSITGGLPSVAIRMPSHPIALELIRESGIYVAAPSANLSGRPSPTTAEHVANDLAGRIDMIIDGGPANVGLESTIVDLTEDTPTILRPGFITLEDIKKVLGSAEMDKALMSGIKENAVPKAPGMKYRHYAPKGDLTIVLGDDENVSRKINELVAQKEGSGSKVAVMAKAENVCRYSCKVIKNLGDSDAEYAAHTLYSYLREFDDMGIEYIYSEGFDEDKLGQALMNRLMKAAAQQVIKV